MERQYLQNCLDGFTVVPFRLLRPKFAVLVWIRWGKWQKVCYFHNQLLQNIFCMWIFRHFISIVTYFSKYGNSIPLSFVLGFYVNVVYTRWWGQYTSIPSPDNIAILVGASIHGKVILLVKHTQFNWIKVKIAGWKITNN